MASPPKKPRDGKLDDDGSGAPRSPVVERIVHNSSGTMELPMLTNTNYHEWALVMQVSMEALGLLDAVEAVAVERHEDRLALAAILRAVPMETKSGLAVKKSAKEAWEAVKVMCMGNERVRDANAQTLLKQFELMAFRHGESVDAFTMRLMSLVRELCELGEKVEDVRAVKKMLRVVPANQAACSIEMLMDLNRMSMEEFIGRLRDAEERGAVEQLADVTAWLLLTKEQWEARRLQRHGKERARDIDNKGDGKDGGRSDDNGGSSVASDPSRHRRGSGRSKCYNCSVRGHLSHDCRQPTKEKVLLAEADEETALL